MGRITLAIVAAIVTLGVAPRPSLAAPLGALPSIVRVNIAGLGTTYARIGSTGGSLRVTDTAGTTVWSGFGNTITRLGVRRLAEPGGAAAKIPDPIGSVDDRLNRSRQLREAKLAAKVNDVPIVTVPFEFSIEKDDPLAPPLFASQAMAPLHFTTTDGLLSYNGRVFRGTLELAKDDEGDMIVVNEVDTASYLASVIGSEEPSTWMPEALASQAIAARTYLATHLQRHDNYDIEGDTRDQQYDGLAGEDRSTVRAVERTAGMVATYNGRPISALYSANAGGITEDSENVYANALPYLRSVASPGDEVAQASSWGHTSWQWTTEYTAPQLRAYLRPRGIDVGDPQRIELTQTTATGRVVSSRIVGSAGSTEIGKDASRYYFGLRSTLFTVTVRPEEPEFVAANNTDRIRQLEFLGAKTDRPYYATVRDPDRSWTLRITGWLYRLPARFVFDGKGFGHGVGMSQWGAQGMALGGASAEDILRHYYQGIAITSLGGA
ncbi:MAG TPA: SpoIID/LytB domain-containing protein [Candidatus Limnocylindria bacterium]|nr:SpoIID/LytB domain-containing protein [Candidatus Limnocylindria bacterium]